MQKSYAMAVAAAALTGGVWLTPASVQGQSVLTVYDRQGDVVQRVGEPWVQSWPAYSPDGTRIAVSKLDETTENTEIWVFEVSTGAGSRLTSDAARVHTSPVWSPDGSQIVYASNPGGSPGLYRRAADGTGAAELLYQHSIGLNVTDWSPDGRFVTFFDATSLYLLPVEGSGERTAVDVFPREFLARGGRFSPDGRFLAYVSSQSGRPEVWVQSTDPLPNGAATSAGPWQISDQGGVGMISWRQDGGELYYLAADQIVMAVELGGGLGFTSEDPKPLFVAPYRATEPISGAGISRDGAQFLFNVGPPPPDARTLSVYDREGQPVRTIGERHPYLKPAFSPDETRLAVIINYEENADLWVFDVETGRGTRIARVIAQTLSNMASFVWSPDGRQLAYVALRGSYYGIYRKSATGAGGEELLYQHPGTPLLTDWSPDGRYLGLFTWETPGATMSVLPVEGAPGVGEPIEILGSEVGGLTGPFFSPDGRFVAYQSGELGRDSIWVRSFDPGGQQAAARTWQISDGDAWANVSDWYDLFGRVAWPAEGDQLYYLSEDLGVMAVDVQARPDFQASQPRLLFRSPPMAQLGDVSRDGERFLYAVPPSPPLNQITLFDRTGTELRRVGEPGLYRSAALSPDGSKVAVSRRDPQTGRESVWTLDVVTGRGVPVTTPPDGPHDDLVQWTSDGSHVAYASGTTCNELYCHLYRRAWNGEGSRELLFRWAELGAPLESINFSADGRFLSFQSGGALFVAPLTGADPMTREATAFSTEAWGQWPTFSPDARFIAYFSVESGRGEYYVQSFDAAAGRPGEEKWQLTTHGELVGGSVWRPDGKEILYTRRLRGSPPPAGRIEVMSVEVTTAPSFQFGEPRVLFTVPAMMPSFTSRASQGFTYDGQTFVVLLPVPAPAPPAR